MAITPFRQPIYAGDRGKDVLAVKRGLTRMNAPGNGGMGASDFAGNAFMFCIHHLQRQHGLPRSHYNQKTHNIVAKHFDERAVQLYKAASIRKHPMPGIDTTAQAAAQQLLKYHDAGKYNADNPADLPQIKAAAQGKAVWSPAGRYLHIDKRVFEILNLIIGKGHKVGTFAICSDHHYDGPHGHSGGLAVDISSVDGIGVSSGSDKAHDATLAVAKLIHGQTGELHPWQLICDGYGYMHSGDISNQTIPSYAFYGYPTMSAHRNHIHVGYYS